MTTWIPKSNTWAPQGSSARTKDPIADALQTFLQEQKLSPQLVLEVASGFGDHVSTFATRLPATTFLPTEAQVECLEKLRTLKLHNVQQARKLNVLEESDWSGITDQTYDGIININMIHISPSESTTQLFTHAARCLKPSGFILLYGPYLAEDGRFSSDADRAFDADLRSRDASFGLRSPSAVNGIASSSGFRLVSSLVLPKNNLIFIWQLK